MVLDVVGNPSNHCSCLLVLQIWRKRAQNKFAQILALLKRLSPNQSLIQIYLKDYCFEFSICMFGTIGFSKS